MASSGTNGSCNGAGACQRYGAGTEVPSGQTPGDCQRRVCNGAGGTTMADDVTDLPVSATVCMELEPGQEVDAVSALVRAHGQPAPEAHAPASP